MTEFKVGLVELEDWALVKEIWHTLKDSKHSWRIEGDEEVLRAFFLGSLTSPYVKMFKAQLMHHTTLAGILIVQHMHDPVPAPNGQVKMVPSIFIRAVYSLNPCATAQLNQALDEYARQNNAVAISGNCRLDFPDRAAMERYGYRATHKILRKEL